MAGQSFKQLYAGVPEEQKAGLQDFRQNHPYKQIKANRKTWRYVAAGQGEKGIPESAVDNEGTTLSGDDEIRAAALSEGHRGRAGEHCKPEPAHRSRRGSEKMKNAGTTIAIGAAVVIAVLLLNAFFIVDETKQAVITFFGDPVTVILGSMPDELKKDFERDMRAYEAERNTKLTIKQGAGLYMKIPFLQKVILLDLVRIPHRLHESPYGLARTH